MKTWHVILLAASIIAAVIGGAWVRAVYDRYQIVAIGGVGQTYRLDKLTGKTALILGKVFPVEELEAPEKK
jgi:hypothetical protein